MERYTIYKRLLRKLQFDCSEIRVKTFLNTVLELNLIIIYVVYCKDLSSNNVIFLKVLYDLKLKYLTFIPAFTFLKYIIIDLNMCKGFDYI